MAQFNIMGINSYADLLEALQRGRRLGRIMELRDGTKSFYPIVTANAQYIRWNNYGSSANKATPREMEFVVTKIFKMTLDEFIRAYIWA